MSEPIYAYKKGEGWVVQPARRKFPNHDYSLICNNCNKRAGEHSAGGHRCPLAGGFADTFWS